ncbi:Short-chain dehydrogenase/reductase SDR [Penicillium coprophilum]|uniref:Short-chain dehydrogenase/reductase SDR n=1 Tax=Penicillium coprophilum TaxID=36646 RepID=UPI00238D5142|nr:Short-chain dehydrogenase/reductase SDR [Penicillium coprophilum]KAJ5162751.1 Short-chain dehydrogenase/reductase SDR [Penicillium coprophilum]
MAAKTIIVTGASRGIGLAVAKYLLTAPQSHNVVVVARSIEPLQKLKEQYGKQVAVLNGDLADFSLAQQAVDIAIKSFGQLDGMVLNHGVLGQIGKIADADVQQWKEGFDINFLSLVAFAKAALPALRESKGKVIFTSSGAAAAGTGYRGWGLYAATKAAMNNFAMSLGAEEPDVTTVSIRPGMVDTEMQRALREDHATGLDAEMHSKFTGVHETGKLLKPEQPGHVMAKLVLDAPKELSGGFYSWNSKELEGFQE